MGHEPECAQTRAPSGSSGAASLLGNFKEFKDLICSIKLWQSAFKTHTKEKTGILKAERLREALLDVGFQLNSSVMGSIVSKYIRKDGTLRFGDFVGAILNLSIAFSESNHRIS